MNIRLEQPKDYREVECLTREAFWNVYWPGCTEHYVLNQYRTNPDFIPDEATYCPPKGYFVADENPEAFEAYEATFPKKEKAFQEGQLPQFCQSCGMPLTRIEDCGTNADGSTCFDYCQYCYMNGQFLQKMTMDEMIE